MSAQTLPGLQGAVVWALVLFENEAPFSVSDDAGATTRYADIRALGQAIRNRRLPPEFTVAIGAKVRPVLLLQDRPQGRLPEYAALKLTRLEKLADQGRGPTDRRPPERRRPSTTRSAWRS